MLSYNLQNVTRAKQGADAAQIGLVRTRQDVLGRAATAYWEWSYQAQVTQIADKSVAAAQEALRVGSLRVEAGELARVELTRLQAALVQAQASRIGAQHALRSRMDEVLMLMGRQPGVDIVVGTELGDVPQQALDLQAMVQVALAQHLELALARHEKQQALTELGFARHERLPALEFQVSGGRSAQQEQWSQAARGAWGEEGFPFVSTSSVLSVPLGNRASRAAVRRAVATVRSKQLAIDALEGQVRAQTQAQGRTLLSAHEQMKLADLNHQLAEETLKAEEARQAAGRSIHKLVLEARSERAQAEAQRIRARVDFRLAQIELLRLQGQLTENNL